MQKAFEAGIKSQRSDSETKDNQNEKNASQPAASDTKANIPAHASENYFKTIKSIPQDAQDIIDRVRAEYPNESRAALVVNKGVEKLIHATSQANIVKYNNTFAMSGDVAKKISFEPRASSNQIALNDKFRVLDIKMLKHYLVTLFLAIITTSTYADIHLIGTASESDKDLLVGDPVYIRDGVINLTYFLKVKNNQYSEVKNRTVNQYGKVVKVNTIKFNIFQKDMVINCNSMSGYWVSDIWWNNNQIVLKDARNVLGQQLLAQKGITTPPTVLEPNSDAQRAAAYQCDHAIKLKQYS